MGSRPYARPVRAEIPSGGLGPRLRMVLESVPVCSVVGDVGAGDGQIASRLRAAGVRAIATELHPKAWSRLPASLEPRLADGLEAFSSGEIEGALIAGLGARTIAGILERGVEVAQSLAWLVLQPQQHPDLLDAWICRHGWSVLARRQARQGGRSYRAVVVRPQG